MWKNNEELSELFSSQEAMALAALLQKADPAVLSKAVDAASKGRHDEARRLLGPLLQDPAVRALIEKMEGNHGRS